MHIQALHRLWAAPPIVAHHNFAFHPTFGCDNILQMIANLGAIKASRVGNEACFGVDLIPGAANAVDQERSRN